MREGQDDKNVSQVVGVGLKGINTHWTLLELLELLHEPSLMSYALRKDVAENFATFPEIVHGTSPSTSTQVIAESCC